MEFTECYARPGQASIIDGINTETGLTLIYAETEAQIEARHPDAVRMTWDAWATEQHKQQNIPVEWLPITERRYTQLLECLPPLAWNALGFLVGEPSDHCFLTGQPRFQACICRQGRHFSSNRPLTIKEWRAVR